MLLNWLIYLHGNNIGRITMFSAEWEIARKSKESKNNKCWANACNRCFSASNSKGGILIFVWFCHRLDG